MYIVSNQPRNIVYDKLNQSTSLQGKMNDASEQSIVKKTAPITAPLALITFCSNKVDSKKSPNGTYIIPKEFPPKDRKALSLYEEYPRENAYPYFDWENGGLTKKAKAKKLPAARSISDEKVIYVSNFDDPMGTVAGTSTLDKTLYTERLADCAAMAVVDKANNTQTLIHVFPGFSKKLNKQIVEHIISPADPKNLEISIVPGYFPWTTSTLQFLIDTVEELVPDVSPKLLEFPHNMRYQERGLMLKNGELMRCNPEDVTNRVVNPKNNITYSKYEEIKWAKAEDITDLLKNTPIPEKFDKKELTDWAIDNNLKSHFYNMDSYVSFEDANDNPVRTVEAVYDFDTHNHIVIKKDVRYIYDSEGNLIDIIKLKNDK